MAEDPFQRVRDAPLFIVPRTVEALRAFRDGPGLDDNLARVADRLLAGVAAHPTKFWVLKQFQPALEDARDAPAETRERVAAGLRQLMDILGIERSEGVLTYYLGLYS
ncbi:DUF4844 domain-containing protein [Telluria mixta]|uniref:DUF4844 domain-containing protein n=1 Tax=Telluria mixta TaxID=34071 RepID=A0ABT2C2F4_9BURK|nr:DUF4844 domain-containing protein [Telluria mixta]MCS0631559.1 DUF4844 domain-containing protein [Telluria mixta]WEM98312.1 DUF4844 domain-containing protein [Telluria mixta]